MSRKLDVRDIVVDHVATLKDARTGRRSRADIVAFFALPILIAGGLIWAGLRLDSTEIAILITALSIFAALLLNLLLLIHSIITGMGTGAETLRRRNLLQELYANISYAILISVVAITLLLIDAVASNSLVRFVVSVLVYFLVSNFLLTLFLVLKRIHKMLGAEFTAE